MIELVGRSSSKYVRKKVTSAYFPWAPNPNDWLFFTRSLPPVAYVIALVY